ncbi:MAG TPA: glycosyltransferase [Solirubrobacteraceae bacterium]|nr:glycosyltransferase [Solirubrobacteraceae bacterium]
MIDPERVSVVIPTNRGGEALPLILERLRSDPAVREILLVDDRAAGACGELLASIPEPVHVLRTTGAVGSNSARELGVASAAADIVLLLDDDVVPEPGLASGHAREHAQPGRVVVGYMPVPAPQDARLESLPRFLYRHEYEKCVGRYEHEPATILTNLWGGNVSLRREDAMRVGLNSPEFRGRRHVDKDFGIRCARAGLVGAFSRDLAASHEYERSLRAFLRDSWEQGYGRASLADVHNPAAASEGVRLSSHLWAVRRSLGATRSLGPTRAVQLWALQLARRCQLFRGGRAALRSAAANESSA